MNNEIWNKFKRTLNIKFHSMLAYDGKYIKAKVRKFNGVIIKSFLDDEIPKENVHYAYRACTTIDSVMRMKKMNYPQAYLEEWKFEIEKIKMTNFINTELESDSVSELESDTELKSKLEYNSDSE